MCCLYGCSLDQTPGVTSSFVVPRKEDITLQDHFVISMSQQDPSFGDDLFDDMAPIEPGLCGARVSVVRVSAWCEMAVFL